MGWGGIREQIGVCGKTVLCSSAEEKQHFWRSNGKGGGISNLLTFKLTLLNSYVWLTVWKERIKSKIVRGICSKESSRPEVNPPPIVKHLSDKKSTLVDINSLDAWKLKRVGRLIKLAKIPKLHVRIGSLALESRVCDR